MARLVAERADTLPALAELFREYGYEGASLSLIGRATGLGKGSLYHFFPGGKAEMAAAVLADIDYWFETNLFAPLRGPGPPEAAIAAMIVEVTAYFRCGRRVCLVGAMGMNQSRDRFAAAIRGYFLRWIEALADALRRGGVDAAEAAALAEEAVAVIQGAIVLTRALDRPETFERAMDHLRVRLTGALERGGP
jgi:AcrR family transcriptional regulator